jgi:uncharacterized protein
VAIWLTATLFSLLHFQFYGFVPRLLLGALFGYLYWWSGNLAVPVLAHFVNNGFTVFIMFLHQKGVLSIDLEQPGQIPPTLALASAGLTVALLYWFWQISRRHASMEKSVHDQ